MGGGGTPRFLAQNPDGVGSLDKACQTVGVPAREVGNGRGAGTNAHHKKKKKVSLGSSFLFWYSHPFLLDTRFKSQVFSKPSPSLTFPGLRNTGYRPNHVSRKECCSFKPRLVEGVAYVAGELRCHISRANPALSSPAPQRALEGGPGGPRGWWEIGGGEKARQVGSWQELL